MRISDWSSDVCSSIYLLRRCEARRRAAYAAEYPGERQRRHEDDRQDQERVLIAHRLGLRVHDAAQIIERERVAQAARQARRLIAVADLVEEVADGVVVGRLRRGQRLGVERSEEHTSELQ